METILPISLKPNFTLNTLGCYGLIVTKLVAFENNLGVECGHSTHDERSEIASGPDGLSWK